MLLEAQKGPESLQEALKVQAGNHRSQQDELQSLIDGLRLTLDDANTQRHIVLQEKQDAIPTSVAVPFSALRDLCQSSQKTEFLLESLPPQLGQLEQGVGRVEGELSMVRKLLEIRPQVETHNDQLHLATPVRGEQQESEVVRCLEETQRTLGERIRTSTLYNAAFTCTTTAITISAVYLLLRGTG